MRGAGGEAQAFGAAGDGGIVDGLHIGAIFGEQYVADPLGLDRIADHQRHDMGDRRHDRKASLRHQALEGGGGGLLAFAFRAGALEVAHARQHARDQHGGEGGGEDEAGRIAADHVDDHLVGRDITAHDAERLAQRPFDDGDAAGDIVAFGNAAAARAIHAHGMDFVEIGQRIIFVGQIADGGDGGDVAIHRIDAFEGDQLGRVGILRGEQFAQMIDVIVAEDALFAARIADARNHRGMVQLVGEDDAAGQQLGEGGERRFVRDIARGEEQSRFLAMQIRKFGFQVDMIMGVAADIAGAARAGADVVQRFLHRGDHLGMLAHGEIVVGAPDSNRLGAVMAVEAARIGEGALVAQDVDEDAIAALAMEPVDRLRKDVLVVHLACLPVCSRASCLLVALILCL